MRTPETFALSCVLLAGAVLSSGPAVADEVPGGCDPAWFVGDVIVDSLIQPIVELEWSAFEHDHVLEYRIGRVAADCARPEACAVSLGERRARTDVLPAPPGVRTHRFLDMPPAGTWIYRLEIIRAPPLAPCVLRYPLLVPAAVSCGAADVCGQLKKTFRARAPLGVGGPGVLLEWSTSAEGTDVKGYVLSRLVEGRSGEDHVALARVEAHGDCGEPRTYGVGDDNPPLDATYRLQVLADGGGCSIVLEPGPVRCR